VTDNTLDFYSAPEPTSSGASLGLTGEASSTPQASCRGLWVKGKMNGCRKRVVASGSRMGPMGQQRLESEQGGKEERGGS